MPSFTTRTVSEQLSERRGLQRVRLDDGSRAYVLTALVGPVAKGDRVVVNTTAVELGLGTGGWHVVHWNLERSSWSEPGGGHIMKLRYTSLQIDTGTAEEHDSETLAEVADLGGRPVVVCSLHSQLACVAVALRHAVPEARIAFVMTDAAALPLALSDLVAALQERGLLDVTVTAGQAFGGDLEAVNVPSAISVATRSAGADVVVVGPGPGVVGSGTALGASAIEIATVADLAGALGAAAVIALRYSGVDPRPRHRGISSSTLVALRLAARPALLAVPSGPLGEAIAAELSAAGVTNHQVERVDAPDVAALLRAAALDVTTMGRSPQDDPDFFTVAGAAGAAAGRALRASQPRGSVR